MTLFSICTAVATFETAMASRDLRPLCIHSWAREEEEGMIYISVTPSVPPSVRLPLAFSWMAERASKSIPIVLSFFRSIRGWRPRPSPWRMMYRRRRRRMRVARHSFHARNNLFSIRAFGAGAGREGERERRRPSSAVGRSGPPQ